MRNILRTTVFMGLLSVLFSVIIACIKVEKKVMVATGSVNNVLANTATAEGTLVDIGEGVTDHGHVYSTTKDVTMSSSKIALGSKGSTGTFTSELSNLTAGTTYYIKAYVVGNGVTKLGKEVTFKTTDPVVPTVTTTAVSGITTTTAISGGNVTADGGVPITARGVCWSTSSVPTVDKSKTTDGPGTGSFASSLTSLSPGTTYYIRSYATNSAGTAYGNEISFTTVAATIPVLTTIEASLITGTNVTSGGNVTSDGGANVTARGVCWSTTQNPTTANNRTDNGSGTGTFTSSIIGLAPNTTYNIRAYATNSAGTAYGSQVSFTTLLAGQFSDIDGNVYNTITIGTQVWMKENLKTTNYNDGTAIPLVADNAEWSELATPAYCWYINDEANFKAVYGTLYNWYAVNTVKLCPTGWHVPADAEWTILTNYLGGESVAGGKLKETSTTHWTSPNIGATNETGFTALPGGVRYSDGSFGFIGSYGAWWGSTEYLAYEAWIWEMRTQESIVKRTGAWKDTGVSVRCIKDN